MTALKVFATWLPLGALVLFLLLRPSRTRAKCETAILDLLADETWWYGLELVRSSKGSLKRGLVYVHLDRLEAAGFVMSCLEVGSENVDIPRRLYRITKLGIRRLEVGS